MLIGIITDSTIHFANFIYVTNCNFKLNFTNYTPTNTQSTLQRFTRGQEEHFKGRTILRFHETFNLFIF